MLDSSNILKCIKSCIPGFLAFLGYYEILSWFRLPFNFTVERITSTYRFSSPLFIGLELDFLFYIFLVLYIVLMEASKDRTKYFFMVVLSVFSIIYLRFSGHYHWIYLVLGSVSIVVTIYHLHHRSFHVLIPGLVVSVFIIEVSALVALSSYYIVGEWLPPFFKIILKERLIYAPLEWFCIIIFMFVLLNNFFRIILNKPLFEPLKIEKSTHNFSRLDHRYLIFFSVILVFILVILPHISTVNPELRPVSVDTFYYKDFFEESSKKGIFHSINSNEIYGRPVFLFFLYYVWMALSGKSILLMDIIYPIVSLSILTLISFYVTRRLHDECSAGYSAILVPLGYLLPAFMAGGFQSNILALSFALIALSVNHESIRGLIQLSILLTLMALIHPWTYLMYTAVIIIYNIRNRANLLPKIVAAIISYIASNLIDFYLISQHVSVNAVKAATGNLGIYFFNGLFKAVRFWVWNSLSNPLYLSLSILDTNTLTTTFMALAFPLAFISPGFLMFRIILNIPLQLGVSKQVSKFPLMCQLLIFLVLLTRVLGNLSGLTPLEG